jgi:hypothetical protein
MNARILVPAASLALVALTGCSIFGEDPSGTPSTEFRSVSAFSEVELQGVGDVTISEGEGYGVTVTTDSAYIDDVVTKVVDGTLELDEDFGHSVRNLKVDFLVTVPSLEAVTLTGAGNITAEDVDTTTFEVRLVGAGNVTVYGTASTATLRLVGAGNIDTIGLEADAVDVDLAGAGDVSVTANDTLDVTLNGVGNVTYVGDPEVTSRVAGIGSVRAR